MQSLDTTFILSSWKALEAVNVETTTQTKDSQIALGVLDNPLAFIKLPFTFTGT